MPGITELNIALQGIKTAADIAKMVKDTTSTFDEASMKLQMIELLDALIDARSQMMDIREEIREKDREIADLKDKLDYKEKTSFDKGVYWIDGDKTPFCPVCNDKDGKLIHLQSSEGAPGFSSCWICQVCRNSFDHRTFHN